MKFFLAAIFIFGVLACAKSGQEDGLKKYGAKDVVINIDDYQVNFPEGEGYSEFKSSCITCHSLRYIEMQPNFPEKTWETIVNKMKKNFGAPISDSSCSENCALPHNGERDKLESDVMNQRPYIIIITYKDVDSSRPICKTYFSR
jgi:hypothetical protein